jgi:hypothetical protein
MSSMMENEAGRDAVLRERIADSDITIYPDGSIPEPVPEEDSSEAAKG